MDFVDQATQEKHCRSVPRLVDEREGGSHNKVHAFCVGFNLRTVDRRGATHEIETGCRLLKGGKIPA